MRKLFTFLLALAASVGLSWATTNSITINESSHGSVVASSSSASAGETITLTATPDDGYQLKSISGVYETQATSSETINFVNQQTTVTGTNFQCVGTIKANVYGWRVYNDGTANTLTVSSLNGTTLIKKIEFTATMGGQRTNDMLSVSAGTLSFDGNTPSTTVTINDINATSVTISGSGTNAGQTWCISSVKVYYEGTDEVELEISNTENANVKTFTMVDGEVTISAEFEPAPAPEPTTYTLQLVADPEKGSVAVTNLLGSEIVDNGDGTYTVPENAEVTILATPLEGYEFSGWKVANGWCDFTECGNALNTNDNPYSFTMTADVSYKAEFAAVEPEPESEPITVTFTNSDFPFGNTCTKDGVTLTAGQGLDPTWGEIYGGGTFTTTLGNFTKIEITTGSGDLKGVSGEGWTSKMSKATWAGTPASSVSFSGDALGDEYLSITCTIEPASTPTAIDNTTVTEKATKRIVNGMLLIEKDGKLYNAVGAEVK